MTSPALFSLLVVDDEPDLRTLYELTLLREGYDVETAGSVEDAWLHLKDRTYSAVITDLRLPDGTGLDLLHRIEAAGRREKTIVITAYGSAENAVEALKAGAFDYLTKPVDLRQFRSVVASALGLGGAPAGASAKTVVGTAALPVAGAGRAAPASTASAPGAAAASLLADEPASSPSSGSATAGPSAWSRPLSPPPMTAVTSSSPAPLAAPAAPTSPTLQRMAGSSVAMQQVRSLIDKVSRSMAPVWIHGESGTGKELVARAIHEVSARSSGPFIAVNCGAIPEHLLEAEFFGYRKGAFTGAQEDREGFFQAARGGTLFLDEIGDLPLSMQSKLLRAIQERAVRPVGAVSEVPIDARILSATHKDLAAEVQAGRFRQDLYYRLNVIQIRVPPLRERVEDLPAICVRLLERIAHEAGMPHVPVLTREALAHLMPQPFAGNVRELENLLHRAVALSGGQQIGVEDLGLPPPQTPSDADWLRRLAGTGPAAAASAHGTPMPLQPAEAHAVYPSWPPAFGSVTTGMPAATGAAAAADWAASAPQPLEATPPAADDTGGVPPAVMAALAQSPVPSDLARYLDDIERDILMRALEQHRCNRTAAGASMGLSLRQMRYRMARLGVQVTDHGVVHDPASATRSSSDEGDEA
ncbi:MAG: sigma 54-interacting transcriptional regulator [Pseudomonadota bacterium]